MRYYIVLTVCGLLALLGGCASGVAQQSSKPNSPAKPNAVVALGRIQPNGEVIKLSVPNAQDSRVDRILVKEGDFVKQNQTIAILQGIDRRQAELRDAQADIKLRQIELERVTEGDFKQAQITGQTAAINKLQAQLISTRKQQQAALISAKSLLSNAEANYQRQLKSQQQGLGLLAAKAKLTNAEAEYRRRWEFDRSGNNISGSQAKLANAEAEYRRKLTLYRSGGMSKSILDKAQEELMGASSGCGRGQLGVLRHGGRENQNDHSQNRVASEIDTFQSPSLFHSDRYWINLDFTRDRFFIIRTSDRSDRLILLLRTTIPFFGSSNDRFIDSFLV